MSDAMCERDERSVRALSAILPLCESMIKYEQKRGRWARCPKLVREPFFGSRRCVLNCPSGRGLGKECIYKVFFQFFNNDGCMATDDAGCTKSLTASLRPRDGPLVRCIAFCLTSESTATIERVARSNSRLSHHRMVSGQLQDAQTPVVR